MIANYFVNFKKYLSKNERTKLAQKNIILSFVLKMINILIALQIVPATIGYISNAQYGIWLTMSSIVGWLAYFDIGFGGGFRFRFAEAKAQQKYSLAKQYVSTTYALLSLLFVSIGLMALVINHFLNWPSLLKLDSNLENALKISFAFLIIFFCINFIVQTVLTFLEADQRPAIAEFIKTLGQFLALIAIYLLTWVKPHGTLLNLVFVFSAIPCAVTFIASIFVYNHKDYRNFSPSFKYIKLSLAKDILNMGVKYFIITSSMFFIFQFINVIITRELGPEAVMIYNVTYKYYNLLLMLSLIILTPIWSAFTEAYTKKDFKWMQSTFSNLEKIEFFFIVCGIIMYFISPFFFRIWLGDKVKIPNIVSLFVCLQIIVQLLPQAYMYMINGTGKMYIQLIVYLIFAIIALPSITILCRRLGIPGISIFILCLFIPMTYFCRKQILLIIKQKAKGLWNR